MWIMKLLHSTQFGCIMLFFLMFSLIENPKCTGLSILTSVFLTSMKFQKNNSLLLCNLALTPNIFFVHSLLQPLCSKIALHFPSFCQKQPCYGFEEGLLLVFLHNSVFGSMYGFNLEDWSI